MWTRASRACRRVLRRCRRGDLAARVSQIDVTDVRDAVDSQNDTALIRMATTSLPSGSSRTGPGGGAAREVPQIDYVDLRFASGLRRPQKRVGRG